MGRVLTPRRSTEADGPDSQWSHGYMESSEGSRGQCEGDWVSSRQRVGLVCTTKRKNSMKPWGGHRQTLQSKRLEGLR